MRQALWILRKDIRHLWPRVAAVWLFAAVQAVADAFLPRNPAAWATLGISAIPLWLAIAFLAISAVHEERLRGDRQYWLTRPYSWKSLLLAKALFLMLFVNLAVFLEQIAALVALGLSPIHFFPQLISHQVTLTAIVLLSCAALAALTANLVEAAIVTVGGYAALAVVMALLMRTAGANVVTLGMGSAAPLDNACRMGMALLFGASVCLVQYSRRSVLAARCLFVCGISVSLGFVHLVPWRPAFALAASRSTVDPAVVRVAPDDSREIAVSGPFMLDPGTVPLFLPIQVTGIPDGVAVYSERVNLTLETAGGDKWISGWAGLSQVRDKTMGIEPTDGILTGDRSPYILQADVGQDFLRKYSTEPVHLHAAIAFTMLGPGHFAELDQKQPPHLTPDGAFCSFLWRRTGTNMSCFTPLARATLTAVRIRPVSTGKRQDVGWLDEMQPGALGSSLFSIWEIFPSASLPLEPVVATFETRQAVAHFERHLDMSGIQLANFRAR